MDYFVSSSSTTTGKQRSSSVSWDAGKEKERERWWLSWIGHAEKYLSKERADCVRTYVCRRDEMLRRVISLHPTAAASPPRNRICRRFCRIAKVPSRWWGNCCFPLEPRSATDVKNERVSPPLPVKTTTTRNRISFSSISLARSLNPSLVAVTVRMKTSIEKRIGNKLPSPLTQPPLSSPRRCALCIFTRDSRQLLPMSKNRPPDYAIVFSSSSRLTLLLLSLCNRWTNWFRSFSLMRAIV